MTIKDIEPKILSGILEDLKNGLLENDVAVRWCSETTYYRWKKEILRVNEKDEVVDADGKVLTKNEKGEWNGEPIQEFKDLVDKAIIDYKHKLIAAITVNSVRSGKVGLEVLRRRWPKEWNVPQKIEHDGRVDVGLKDIADLLQKVYQEDDKPKEDTNNTPPSK